MKKPPRCPTCNFILTRVNATGKSTWIYDNGHYDNMENYDATLSCPNCHTCLDELFIPNIYYWSIE